MSVAPGWYDDGVTPAVQRWYDGAAWTEHTRAVPRLSGAPTSGATSGAATSGAATSGAATSGTSPTGVSAPVPFSPVWPATTAWPVNQARGPVSKMAASAPAIETPRAVARGAQPAGRPASPPPHSDGDPFGKGGGSEKYPDGWGPSGYEIGPDRRRGRPRPKLEPATDWPPQPTGVPASGDEPPSWNPPEPWPLPSQPFVPAVRPGAKPSDPVHWLIPVGRSWQSIVAGYLGLIGLLIWPLAPFAVWLGFWGRSLARVGGHGGGRATFAIVSGLVGTFVGVLVLMAALRG